VFSYIWSSKPHLPLLPPANHKQQESSELKEAADRLASALADVDEEELVADFKELRRRGKDASR
jgi:hypothetical protein